MKLISSLLSFVLLLSVSTAAAWDKDGNLQQDTRPALIGQQLLDGNTAIQEGKESSYGFLEAIKNRLLPWWTNHDAKLDNNNDSETVHPDKEYVRSVSSTHLAPTPEQEGRRQLEECTFADGTSGPKCVGYNACVGIDTSNIGCGSCNGDFACSLENPTVSYDRVFVGENSCNGVKACNDHIVDRMFNSNGNGAINIVFGKGSW
jgi:hypothetical protein